METMAPPQKNPHSRAYVKRMLRQGARAWKTLEELGLAEARYNNRAHNERMKREHRLGWHSESLQRTLEDYAETHILLMRACRGNLKDKRVLQVGASTGVYARYLHDRYHAKAVALDLNFNALKEAQNRGTRLLVQSSGVHEERGTKKFVPTKSGLLAPGRSMHHLPFGNETLDFVLSENFLFSNYHSELKGEAPGFEEGRGSFSKSEKTLKELNRVLRTGGKVILESVHPEELPGFPQMVKRFPLYGFKIETAYGISFQRVSKSDGPHMLVLRKTRPV